MSNDNMRNNVPLHKYSNAHIINSSQPSQPHRSVPLQVEPLQNHRTDVRGNPSDLGRVEHGSRSKGGATIRRAVIYTSSPRLPA